MADIASLSLSVDSSQVEQATLALGELPKAASAAERAAEKWKTTTTEAARSSEDFSRRVRKTIADLEFERQQLARSATEKQKYNILRRAGVAEASAEGQAIMASVRALQAQQSAVGQTSVAVKAYRTAWSEVKSVIAGLSLAAAVVALFNMGKAAFEAAAGMEEVAQQVGLTAKAFQALQFQATANGVGVEQLDTAISKFSQKMGEAAEGSKEMIEALQKIGVKNLDVQGKLRPTEDLLVDVAKAITSIDDPARRAAAAVDFFGKSGTRMLPLLGEIAKGTDSWVESARNAGAIIGDQTIEKLDKLSDKMAQNRLVFRANMAEMLGTLDDWRNQFNAWASDVGKSIEAWSKKVGEAVTGFVDDVSVEGTRAAEMFLEAFRQLPETLGDLFANAWSMAKSATAKGVNSITAWVAANAPDWMGLKGVATDLDTSVTLRGGNDNVVDRVRAAGDKAAADMRAQIEAAKASEFTKSITPRRATSTMGDVRGGTVGASTSAAKDAGKEAEDAEKKFAKLITTLTQTAAAQDEMTAAAGRGEVAFENMKVHVDAQNKALDIFGKALNDNDPKLVKLEELMRRIAQGKIAENFQVATTELNNQNVILQKQIELMNEAPEIQAREIALIKAKQDAEKAGTAITQDMIDARKQAIEQNETLKAQAEQMKRINELWMEPLKTALSSIQTTAADAFQSMLESGKFSMEELGNVFKKTITRMIAEFLALATVRPVMSVLVNAVSPQLGQQMGLGTGNIGSAVGGGGLFSGLGGFLNSPISFGGSLQGSSPAAIAAPHGATGSMFGGITWGQGLGALAGAGMGIYQLARGGGSTASTLGGIASIAGAGISLIPGIGQVAGPIIGLLGGLLPSLFGGGAPEPPTVRNRSSVNFSGGMFASSGSADLGGIGSGIKGLLDFAKVKIDKLTGDYGLQVEALTKGDFSNQTVFVNGRQWGQSSDPQQIQKAMDTAMANIAHSMMLEASSGISDIMRSGLVSFGTTNLQHAFSTEELQAAVTKLSEFDEALKSFASNSSDAEKMLKQIDDGFKSLYDTAKEFNISANEVAKIDAERNRQRLDATKDFAESFDMRIKEMRNPLQAQLEAMDKARNEDIARNDDYVRLVVGYQDKRLAIEAYYAMARQKVLDDANAESLAKSKAAAAQLLSASTASLMKIQDLVRELIPGGSLSGLDPRSQLAGLRATADASLASAMANPSNSSLIDRAVADQRAFIEFNKSFSGGGADYQQDVQGRLDRLRGLQGSVASAAMNQTSDPITHNYLAQILGALQRDTSGVDRVIALLERYIANPDAAAA